jgi:hypothetical protein
VVVEVHRLATAIGVVIGAIGIAIAVPVNKGPLAIAHADQYDKYWTDAAAETGAAHGQYTSAETAFLAQLKRDHVTVNDAVAMVIAGHAVCGIEGGPNSPSHMTEDVAALTARGMSTSDAETLALDAESQLCV